ncbi:uncharacterized protein K02A2.6-like [Frankliniella occidentalis]|uniref:RNA-directed DNA polymerase n=1 Tax=Frankliniella occidentalis TaxID=133901 RepID=A0A6J1TFX7_FRAOC|nr:uncharacterized protein K02A2.6-like [Frankliniella occidentalis]
MLHDRIIWGVYDKKLRENIRSKAKLPLDDIVDICKAVEATAKYPRTEDGEGILTVDTVQHVAKKFKKNHQGKNGKSGGSLHQTKSTNPWRKHGNKTYQKGGPKKSNKFAYLCRKCDKTHGAGNCPAWGTNCTKCNGRNHFAAVCKSRKGFNPNKPQKDVDSLSKVTNELRDILINPRWQNEFQQVSVHMLTIVHDNNKKIILSGESTQPRDEYTEVLKLQNEHFIKFKLDSGSEVNSLPLAVFKMINRNYPVYKTDIILKAYGKVLSTPVGEVRLLVETPHGDKMMCKFIISSIEPKPLLGKDACEKLNLVVRVKHPIKNVQNMEAYSIQLPDSKNDFVKKYFKLFTGMGEFQQKVEIMLDPTFQPVMCPARRYHFSIIQRLKTKLDDLERDGIVAKVTNEIPKFVSNMVIREKSNGDLRICLDPEQLNKAIQRSRYAIPTFDELSYKVRDQEIFTVLDLKWGFWHATLDEKSSMLCTFSTPHGLYRFLKMPFGLCSAPETFQFLTEQAFRGTDAIIYFDDCLITGKNYAEHDYKLAKFMEKANEQNIRFNIDKLQYRRKEVKFLGQLLSKNATKVDPERVKAISAINEPKTKKQLQKCLGTFNYVRKFLPQMATIAAPLYQLLSSKVNFQWLPAQAQAFKALKEALTTAPVLATFDSSKPIVIQADASQFGLGCCLLQNKQPVALDSRILTETERNYAQIEKEMLALTFAAQKFEKYIWGMPNVLFQTDHQPLVSIFKKPIFKITNNRLKKMRIKLLRFQPNVEYLPGKHMHIADLLSRNCLNDPVQDDPEMVEVVHEVTKYLPLSPDLRQELAQQTDSDVGLTAVKQYYKNGWPNTRQQTVVEARPYWQVRNDLFVEDTFVVLTDRIVVPLSLRKMVLKRLHTAHLGIEKTKARARQSVYWPGMSNDIATMTKECRACERHSARNYHEPLIPHEIPSLRFQKIGLDILELNSKCYLVVEDYLSKWLEIKPLTSKNSKAVIDQLRLIFCTHGIPEIIFGDNNPLNSQECHEFATSMGSKIVTSSPEYSCSNGLAEKGVHIAKQMLKKCNDDKTHYLDALREYNNTPLSGMDVSPAEILMSRKVRTVVPTLKRKLEPKIVLIKPILKRLQEKLKLRYDQRARRKPIQFKEGDAVTVLRGKKWHKGKIFTKHPADRSYVVELLGGGTLRRNTFFIRPSITEPDRVDSSAGTNHQIDIESILVNLRAGQNSKPPARPNPPNPCPPLFTDANRSRSGRRLRKSARLTDDNFQY